MVNENCLLINFTLSKSPLLSDIVSYIKLNVVELANLEHKYSIK